MKSKNLKLSVYLGGIICLIFALFLFWPNCLMAQEEVVLTEFIDNDVRCIDSTAVVDLSWTSIIGGSPDYYILRKIEGEVDFMEFPIDPIKDIFYTDNSIDSDKTYVYQIRAEKGSNIFYSNHATTTKEAYCPPIFLPSSTSCHADGPYINLSWSPISGDLLKYEIYRDGVKINETTNTFYEDGPDIIGTASYEYFIKGLWQDGVSAHYNPESPEVIPACEPTVTASGSCLDSTAPGGPVMNLSWNKLLGVQKYQIYRQALEETDFSLLTEITDEAVISFNDQLAVNLPNAYYNSGTINYKVQAVWESAFRASSSPPIDIPRCQPFLSITNNCDSFSFNLKWTATQGSNVIYNIYRDIHQGDGLKWQHRNDGITKTSYEDGLDEVICSGEACAFDYRIEAIVNVIDILSSDTVPTSINCTTAEPPSPAPVLNEPTISCNLGKSLVSLSWSASDNVTYYTVYRTSEGATSELITSATEYLDTGIEVPYDYTYRVTAFGNGGHIDGPNVYTITAIDCSAPSAPDLSLTTDCNSGGPFINLSWAETTNTVSYDIYRGPATDDLSILITVDSSTLELSDSGVSASIDYYYKIVANGPPGADSVESEIQSITTYSCAPTTPDLSLSKACESGSSIVNLNWSTDLIHENTDSYEIFREDFGLIKTIYPADTSWQDNSVSSETAYNYRIEAVGPTGLRSIDPASGYKSITTYNCGPPGDFTLSDAFYCQGSYPKVDLSWTDSANADSYNITRFNNTTAEETTFSDKISVFTDWGFGRFLNFDGSNDYINCGNDVSLQITGDQTYEFWIKPDNFTKRRNPINKAYGGEGTITLETNGAFSYFWGTAGSNSSPYQGHSSGAVIPTGEWTHVAHVRDITNGVMTWYFNGDPVGAPVAPSYAAAVASGNNLWIGDGYVYPIDGQMDEVRIYGRALTAIEVKEHYQGIFNNENNLAGLWHFDEGAGNTASDSSNEGNNGIIIGATWVENGLQTGENYNWQATAFGVGGETDSNSTMPITINCPPSKPGLVLEPGCNGVGVPTVNLGWSYSYGATSFEIYRDGVVIANFVDGDAEFVSRDWTDDAGLAEETTYNYLVKAIGLGSQTDSDYLQVTTANCAKPSIPENLQAVFGCDGSYPHIDLIWLESTGAAYYTVYRNSGEVGWPEINLFTDKYNFDNPGAGVQVDTYYQYFVTPFSSGGIPGDPSNAVEIPVGNFCTPSTLSITSLTTACESWAPVNTLTWSDDTDFNTIFYEIYRDGTAETDKIATQGILSYSDSDASLQSLTNYTYYIRAVGLVGNSPDFASKTISTYSCGAVLSAPTLTKDPASPYCQDNIPRVDLSWNSIDNAYSYNLYRINPNNSVSTSSTAVSPFTDKGDHALNFDGSNDYVNIPNDDSLNPGTITMEAWIYPTSYSSYGNIISKRYSAQYILRLYYTTGRVQGYVYVNGGWRSCTTNTGVTAGLNQWSHIVSTYNGSKIKVYINGVEGCSYSYAGNINSGGANLRIGAYSASSERFKGMIDEVRIYGRALSLTEIQDHYNNVYKNETDLRGIWHFNQESGSTVYDDSGNSNNGSLINMDENSWTFALDKPNFIFPLQSNATYKYKIKAMGVDTESDFSNEIEINTDGCLDAPAFGLFDRCTDYHNPVTVLYWENQKSVTEYQVYKDGVLFESRNPADFISTDGFIKHWLLIGPYENNYNSDTGQWEGYYTDYIDEEIVRPRKGETVNGQTWDDYFSSSNKINFLNIFSPNTNRVSYAFAYIYSPFDQSAELWIGSDDGVKAFLNGVKVHDHPGHRGITADQDKIPINLIAGINTLLIKVDQGSGGWALYARIVDASGNNILNNITIWDSLAETGVSADYYVKARILEEESGNSDILTSTPSDCEPAKPDLTVDAKCESGISKLFLSWGADPNDLTQSYTVHKKRPSDDDWDLDPYFPVILDKIEIAYADSNVTSEITYIYYIDAVGKGISTSSDAIFKEAMICYPAPTQPIINVDPKCLGDYPRMEITWNETDNTIGFNIWRKNNTLGETDYTLIKSSLSPESTSYSDRGASLIAKNKYEYKVEAVGAGMDNSKLSESSGEKIAIDCANIAPLKPILAIRLTDAYGHYAYASLAWIDSGNEDKYIVLRDDVEIAELVQGTADYNEDDLIINYIDDTVSDYTDYVYKIKAVNDIGTTTSNAEIANIPMARPGAFVVSASWIKDTEDILLTWTEAASTTAGGIVSYKVLRDDTTDFIDAEEICTGIESAPFECSDDSPTLLIRYYSVEATNFGGTTNSNTVDIITVILPTWKEVKP